LPNKWFLEEISPEAVPLWLKVHSLNGTRLVGRVIVNVPEAKNMGLFYMLQSKSKGRPSNGMLAKRRMVL
jgi:hypothetical protein